MISYLRESTFVVNHVINKSWDLLKKHYFSIAGLFLILFLTSNISAILATFISEVSVLLSGFMLLLFLIIYFGTQLTLIKYNLILIKKSSRVRLRDAVPTTKELLNFFVTMILLAILAFATVMLVSTVLLPLIYLQISVAVMASVSVFMASVLIFFLVIRLSFYPFFIVDRQASPLLSIRLSLAVTRGNVTKLLLILVFFAILQLLNIYVNYRGFHMLSMILSLVNSFFIVPLSSVVMAVAYRNMMEHYKGSDDPEVLSNII